MSSSVDKDGPFSACAPNLKLRGRVTGPSLLFECGTRTRGYWTPRHLVCVAEWRVSIASLGGFSRLTNFFFLHVWNTWCRLFDGATAKLVFFSFKTNKTNWDGKTGLSEDVFPGLGSVVKVCLRFSFLCEKVKAWLMFTLISFSFFWRKVHFDFSGLQSSADLVPAVSVLQLCSCWPRRNV